MCPRSFSVAGIHWLFFGVFKVSGTEDLWLQFVIARWFAQYGWDEKLRALVKRRGRFHLRFFVAEKVKEDRPAFLIKQIFVD